MLKVKQNNIDIELTRLYGKSVNPYTNDDFYCSDEYEDYFNLIEYVFEHSE